ncbi:MAG: hypothetical protein PVJ53_15105 [Desulfobacterales bacterium]|jgi:hypothetical protein
MGRFPQSGRKCPFSFPRPYEDGYRQEISLNLLIDSFANTVIGDDLQIVLAEFGSMPEAKIISDHRLSQPKGFGFVEMPRPLEAD